MKIAKLYYWYVIVYLFLPVYIHTAEQEESEDDESIIGMHGTALESVDTKKKNQQLITLEDILEVDEDALDPGA